ncbi:MAG: hypothetical protein ABI560_03505, partial [Myxococcales bacterium]
MLGLLPLAGLMWVSGQFAAYGSAVGELRVGQAPVVAGRNPVAGVATALTPIGQLEYTTPNRQVILEYGPRLLWRQPNLLESKKLLVLHVADLSVTLDVTPTVRLVERAAASYGEADYAALTQIFGRQSNLPQVMDIFAVSAGTGLRWDANRIWRYEAILDVEHREVVGDISERPSAGVPGAPPVVIETPAGAPPVIDTGTFQISPSFRQTNLQLDSSAIARIDRRNDLVLTLGGSDRILDNGVDIVALTPRLGWRTRLARTTELRLAAGVTYVRDRGARRLVGEGGIVRPVGDASIDTLLLGRRNVAWRGGAGVTLDYFVEPFLPAVGPRVIAVARSLVLFEPSWTVGVEGLFASSLRGTPPTPTARNVDETVVSVALPVRHRVSKNFIVETGVRWSVLAPRIRADDVTFHQRQTWIYVSLTGTTRRVDEWIAPRDTSADTRDEGMFARAPSADASRQAVEEIPAVDTVGGVSSRPPTSGPAPQPAPDDSDSGPGTGVHPDG